MSLQQNKTEAHSASPVKKDKPRIAFLVSHLNGFGGAERVACDLANRLCDTCDVYILALYGNEEDAIAFEIDERIATHVFFAHEGRLRTMAKELRKPLREFLSNHQVEVLFLEGDYQGFVALPAHLFSRTKFVFCDHGAIMNQWDNKDIRLIRFLCSRFYARTVVLTERSRHDYLERFHLHEEKIVTISNAIGRALFEKPHQYNRASRKLLWAGRLSKEKGWSFLVDIASRVLPSNPDWTWDVCGDGEDYEALRQAIECAGLEKQLVLKGRVSGMYDLYKDYALLTLTSYREGLPLVLLEAKACHLPLVSFDILTGPAEIIRDGVDGFLVDCYDCEEFSSKVIQLMQDDELRASFSRATGEDVQRFAPAAIDTQWMALIGSLR